MKGDTLMSLRDFFVNFLTNTEGMIELRAIQADGPIQDRLFSRSIAEIQTWIEANKAYNLYYGINTRHPDTQTGSKRDIFEICAFQADLDFKDYGGGEEEAKSRLEAFPLKPTMLLNSGGGYQALWVLTNPLKCMHDISIIVEGINLNLAKILGADHCHDVARVFRIPDTTNYPNQKKRDAGRVPVQARIVYDNGPQYTIEDFEDYRMPQNQQVNTIQSDQPHTALPNNQVLESIELIDRLPSIKGLWEGKGLAHTSEGKVDRSKADYQLVRELLKHEVAYQDIVNLFTNFPYGKAGTYQGDARKYIESTINAAKESSSHEISGADNFPFSSLRPLSQSLPEYDEWLKANKDRKLRGVDSGFSCWNEFLQGVHGLTVLAGVAGSGKSMLAIQLAIQVLKQSGKVLYLDVENGKCNILTRITSYIFQTSDSRIRSAGSLERQWLEELTDLLKSFFLVTDPNEITPDLIENWSRIAGPKLIVCDSLQKISPILYGKNSRTDVRLQIDECMRFFEQIRNNSNTSCLLISEINRASSQTAHLGAFKESSSIEYGADMAIILQPDKQGSSIAIEVVKNRYGTTGCIGYLHRPTPFYWGLLEGTPKNKVTRINKKSGGLYATL